MKVVSKYSAKRREEKKQAVKSVYLLTVIVAIYAIVVLVGRG